jgi:hypothetical protein
MDMSDKDLADLKRAKDLLESPGFAMKITNLLAKPIGEGLKLLPNGWQSNVQLATQKALDTALTIALATLDGSERPESSDFLHKLTVFVSGALGGAFGIPALTVELPFTTTVMLRSIADIARSEGEDLGHPDSKLACLEVFAFGGDAAGDDAADTGYFVVRATLAKAVAEAAQYIAERGLAEEGAPVLIRLTAQIAMRFGIVVSEKAAATAIPILGAAGGAMVNTAFNNHFQSMAHGHFIVRRLERAYSPELVKEVYMSL